MAQSGISQTPDVTSKTQYALVKQGLYIKKNYASVKQVVAATVSAAAGGQLDEATVSSKADEQIVTMTSGLSQCQYITIAIQHYHLLKMPDILMV